ncbi:MAG TPA: DNA repair protein RecN [Pyrinomonadaceae bacterium]|jgi:DNA repair protein RecN (Recombination protein N)
MLKFLNITNFAVIQRLGFELHEGLNLLTGETGAGKSIIVDALGLLLGGRATAGVVRTGERAAFVEGQFELKGSSEERVRAALCEIGIEKSPEEDLWIRREVQAGGRGRIFINDQSVTAATLRRLQPSLLEIHGQGEQQALAASRTHLKMLDNFAGCADLRASVGRAYTRYRVAFDALRSLERDEAARERAGDMLRFQIDEIEKASPTPSEDEELAAERSLLAHAGRAQELSAGAYAALYESDESVLSGLSNVRRRLQELSAIDGRVAVWLENLEAANLSLTDVAEALRGYGVGVDFSPGRLGEVENRLAELERLKRKYGRDLQGLLEVKEELKRQLQQLGNLAERERELLEEVEAASKGYIPLAESLTARRLEAAPRLEEQMMEELRHVALERARFVVQIETAARGMHERRSFGQNLLASDNENDSMNAQAFSYWSASGADRVEFLFSANIGESVRPLSRVASGGELSRLMLTLRTVCRNAQASEGDEGVGESAAALVFDEIDTGIGGRVAEAVGRRLKALAATKQVLCVTHQAQIARFADHHYVVSKQVEEGRTVTSVRELEGEARVGELARMIGGAETVETARQTARWMLEQPSAEEAAAAEPDSKEPGRRAFKKKGAAKKGRGARKGKGSRLARENSATLAQRKEG